MRRTILLLLSLSGCAFGGEGDVFFGDFVGCFDDFDCEGTVNGLGELTPVCDPNGVCVALPTVDPEGCAARALFPNVEGTGPQLTNPTAVPAFGETCAAGSVQISAQATMVPPYPMAFGEGALTDAFIATAVEGDAGARLCDQSSALEICNDELLPGDCFLLCITCIPEGVQEIALQLLAGDEGVSNAVCARVDG